MLWSTTVEKLKSGPRSVLFLPLHYAVWPQSLNITEHITRLERSVVS